jgi:hypothetical protein
MGMSDFNRRVFQPTINERLWAIEGVGELLEELIRLNFETGPCEGPMQGMQVLAATLKRETSALCETLEALDVLNKPCPSSSSPPTRRDEDDSADASEIEAG